MLKNLRRICLGFGLRERARASERVKSRQVRSSHWQGRSRDLTEPGKEERKVEGKRRGEEEGGPGRMEGECGERERRERGGDNRDKTGRRKGGTQGRRGLPDVDRPELRSAQRGDSETDSERVAA